MDNPTLCTLAKIAKKRLKENSYKSINKLVINTSMKKNKPSKVDNTPTPAVDNKDEILYLKICKLLASGKVLNPIAQLIEYRVFYTLSLEAKQRYIYNLKERYAILKQRYYKEHFYNYALI